jgi:hypothetical protein
MVSIWWQLEQPVEQIADGAEKITGVPQIVETYLILDAAAGCHVHVRTYCYFADHVQGIAERLCSGQGPHEHRDQCELA